MPVDKKLVTPRLRQKPLNSQKNLANKNDPGIHTSGMHTATLILVALFTLYRTTIAVAVAAAVAAAASVSDVAAVANGRATQIALWFGQRTQRSGAILNSTNVLPQESVSLKAIPGKEGSESEKVYWKHKFCVLHSLYEVCLIYLRVKYIYQNDGNHVRFVMSCFLVMLHSDYHHSSVFKTLKDRNVRLKKHQNILFLLVFL